jgi:hypothetical protein
MKTKSVSNVTNLFNSLMNVASICSANAGQNLLHVQMLSNLLQFI